MGICICSLIGSNVYFTIYTYLHQLFAMFSGRLQHLPEFKFPASTTHQLPPLKYKPRFQFFSGSHAMSSAKWSWYFTTILEYIKWFLVEKIRFFSEAETFIYPFYRLFYLDYVQYNLVKPPPSVQPDFGVITSLTINWVRTENRKSTVWF
jgi:hypothetical protein